MKKLSALCITQGNTTTVHITAVKRQYTSSFYKLKTGVTDHSRVHFSKSTNFLMLKRRTGEKKTLSDGFYVLCKMCNLQVRYCADVSACGVCDSESDKTINYIPAAQSLSHLSFLHSELRIKILPPEVGKPPSYTHNDLSFSLQSSATLRQSYYRVLVHPSISLSEVLK